MVNKVQQRINLLENSIKLLKTILKNYGTQNESKPVDLIQNRIRSYNRELQIRKDYRT